MLPCAMLGNPEAIREQVKRILSCRDFDASERNRRFLEYVVEETIEGRAERIKAYSIATSVFGRNESFDPQQDAIVRIEAGRMRRSLEHYYLTSGLSDPIRISIPIGSYVPSFSLPQAEADAQQASSPAPPAHSAAREPVHRPTVQVSEFVAEGSADGIIDLARGITRRVIVGLTRFTDLAVVGPSSPEGHSKPNDSAAPRCERGIDFILSGAIAHAEGHLSAEVLLRDTSTGQYIWSDDFELTYAADSAATVRGQIADRVVAAVGQPFGIIFSYMARERAQGNPVASESFDSVVRFHDYWRTFDREQFEPVRQALERTTERDPYYAEAFACLSQLYSNSVRFGYKGTAPHLDPIGRAITLAQRAVQLSPASSRAYLALAIAYWFSGQVDSAINALETSRSLNPNDMEVLAELGLRHAARTNWQTGIPMIEEAYRRSPSLSCSYRIGLSMWHSMHGRPDEALSEASKINMPWVIYPFILIAVSAHQLGRQKEAAAALKSLLLLRPDYGTTIVTDLKARNIHPDIISAMVRGLRDAGLACGPAAISVSKRVPVKL